MDMIGAFPEFTDPFIWRGFIVDETNGPAYLTVRTLTPVLGNFPPGSPKTSGWAADLLGTKYEMDIILDGVPTTTSAPVYIKVTNPSGEPLSPILVITVVLTYS